MRQEQELIRRYLRADEKALKQHVAASLARFLDPAVTPSLADELEPHVATYFEAWDQEDTVPLNYRTNTQ